eukprot:m.352332 g.352332  ORF g.352332 m.352332 type:complete len:99 (-) comp16490_c0_seq1:146-442(-)
MPLVLTVSFSGLPRRKPPIHPSVHPSTFSAFVFADILACSIQVKSSQHNAAICLSEWAVVASPHCSTFWEEKKWIRDSKQNAYKCNEHGQALRVCRYC